MNLRRGKQLRRPCGIFSVYRRTYGSEPPTDSRARPRPGNQSPTDVSPAGRATTLPTGRRRSGAARAAVAPFKLRRAERLPGAPGGDLAARLRVAQRTLRGRLERRETLIDFARAVSSSPEPGVVAEALVEHASSWIPAPWWAVVAVDISGDMHLLAERGVDSEMRPAISLVARWVLKRGEEFLTADLGRDERVEGGVPATVIALPLSCRDRGVAALVAVDPAPSSREPRLAPALRRALSTLLEPAAFAVDNALLLRRAEELSVTDDLTQLYNT